MEREHAPIRVEPGEAGRLIVRLPYTPERVAKIKTVDGRRWHGPEKYWSVPRDESAPARLRILSPAIASNSTPLWRPDTTLRPRQPAFRIRSWTS